MRHSCQGFSQSDATGRCAIIEQGGEVVPNQHWHRDPSFVTVGRVLYSISSPLRNLCLEFGTRKATAQLWSKVTSNILKLPVNATAKRTTLKTRWLRKFDTATSAATEVKLG